jgi:hypothetical protein
MSNIVNDLLELAEAADRQAEEKRQAEIKQQIEQLRRFISPLLGRLLEAGAQMDQPEYATHNDGKAVAWLQVCVAVPGLLPFWVVAKPFGPDQAHVSYQTYRESNQSYNHSRERLLVNASDNIGVGRLLLSCKQGWQKAEQERQVKQALQREEEASTLCRSLQNWSWNSFPKSETEAEALLQKIAALTSKIDLEGLREAWRDAFEKYQAHERKEQAEREARHEQRQLYQQKLAEFKAAWQGYVAARESTWVTNRARLAALQEQYNQPFEVYELCYALYTPAVDEDGPYAEKQSVDCLWPYQNGFHREIGRNGVIRPYRYSDSHVYKIGMERQVQPASYKNAGRYQLMDLLGEDVALRYTPGTDPEEIAAAVQQTFEPAPAEPEPDPMLSYNDVKRIQHGQEPEDDIPF